MHPAIVSSLLLLLACAAPAAAASGREVIDNAQKKHGFSTWKDRTLSCVMESYDGDTLARERTFDVSEQTDPRGDHKTFLNFTGPLDVKGTMFLHISPRGERDQQWLWSPSTRRVRRLAEAQQDENFFGSDLSYRDLELIVRIQQWNDSESTATLLPDETLDGKPCQVVELVPRNDEFAYTRYRLWFEASSALLLRVDVYDPDDREKVLKRVTLAKFERVQNYTTALEADVRNVPADTHTLIKTRDAKYDTGISEGVFSLANLSKGE